MKRIFSYISILAAIAFAASCNIDNIYPDDANGNDNGFTLRLQTMSLETKAGVAGEGVENTVTHADFFFFKDKEGTDLIYNTRLTVGTDAATDLVKKGDANIYEHKFGEYTEEDDLSGTSYVYVIANYPEEITATTLDDILALDIKTDLSDDPQYFVMDSFNSEDSTYVKELKPTKKQDGKNDGEAVFTIGLTRAAAKLVLTVKIADNFLDDAGNDWTPVIDQMWVNFVNARKSAIVKAEPVAFDAKANFYSTARESNTAQSKTWKTTAVYTYPQSYSTSEVTAPYYKIFLPWICEKKGLNNFYYKVILPELDSFKRNKIYQLTVDVSVIGGTEDEWALASDYIFVADWWSPDEIEAEFEGAMYLDVPVKKYEIYGLNSITVPVVSSNDIRILSVTARQQTVKETVSDASATHPIRSYTCVPDGSESFTLTYDLDQEIDLTNESNTSFDCTPIYWTVTVQHKQEGDAYLSKTVDVEIIQYPSIYAYLQEGGNSFINGYYALQTASVTPKPNTEDDYTSNDGKTYYRYDNNTNLNAGNYGRLNQTTSSDKGSTMTIITVTAFDEGSGTYNVYSNGTTDGAPGSGNKTEFEYIIGDPRVPLSELDLISSASLQPYLWGNNTQAWNSTIVSNIMVAGTEKNIIAPAYMFSSDRGGRPGNNGVVYENAVKRCATYQEDGYPAGRWRLPTEAELYFAYSLQHMNVIPHLFNGGAGYHASTSNVFDWTNNGNGDTFQAPGTGDHSIRCVYDIWYWGAEPAVTGDDVHTYYPGTLN